MLAQQRSEQGRLPRPVASDDPEHAGTLQRSVEPLHQRALADRDTGVLCRDDLIATPIGYREPQRHRPVSPDDRAEPRQTFEAFAPPLGLFAVLPGDVAGDVVALFGYGLLLLFERALLRQPALGALRDKV